MRRFEYSAVFDRLEETLAGQVERVAEERAAAPALLEALLSLPEEERYGAILAGERYHSYAMVGHLLERSEKALGGDPRLALTLARLARLLAPKVEPSSCGGTAALADVEAFALALEATALGAVGQVGLAEELFGGVRTILEQGGTDLYLNARTDLLEALLRRDLGEMEEALYLVGRALRSLVSLGEKDRARALLDAGRTGMPPLQLLTPPQGSPTAVH